MELLAFMLWFKAGTADQSYTAYNPAIERVWQQYTFEELGVATRENFFHLFYIQGSMRVITDKDFDTYAFSPLELQSRFEGGIRYTSETLEFRLGFQHMCVHPITPYFKENKGAIQYDSFDKGFFASIAIKTKGWN